MNLLNSVLALAESAGNAFQAAGYLYIGVGLVEIGMGFSAIAEGLVCASALKGMARNPEMAKNLRTSMILGVALCETTAIYGLVLAIMMMFVVGPKSF